MIERKTFCGIMMLFLISVIGVLIEFEVVSRICVLLQAVICITLGKREERFVNPFYLFVIVPVSLLIYANITVFHFELNHNTWAIAIINISAFLIAMMATKPYKQIGRCIGVGGKYLTHIVILTAMGYFSTIYTMLTGRVFFLASIFGLFIYPSVMVAMRSRNKFYIAAVVVLILSTWITYVSKTTVLSLVFALLIGYERYFANTPRKRKQMITLSIIGFFVMLAAFSFANQGRGIASGFTETALEYYSRTNNIAWNYNEKAFLPYMYITTPWANLQYVMETQNTKIYGLWFLKPLLNYFQIDGMFADKYVLTAYSSFNTFTYIACGYKDFGLYGSCISSLFLGYFVKKVYSRSLLSSSPLDLACYVMAAQATLEMFFSNHFFMQSYPFTIVLIMEIYKLVFCRTNRCDIDYEMEE